MKATPLLTSLGVQIWQPLQLLHATYMYSAGSGNEMAISMPVIQLEVSVKATHWLTDVSACTLGNHYSYFHTTYSVGSVTYLLVP